jgi:hypothetical protein
MNSVVRKTVLRTRNETVLHFLDYTFGLRIEEEHFRNYLSVSTETENVLLYAVTNYNCTCEQLQ